ncbi:MAG: AsnC family transcriptional regulator [Deltaproteobacteria bacterium]|nr:AsnC family transcriptional regulator [Deltaproteobacteria bacterium]
MQTAAQESAEDIANLDDIDRAILRAVQSRLPLDERPYLVLGRKLGLPEDTVLERLARLKKIGVIRRIGGNFNSSLLGFASTLCGAKVPDDKIEMFVDLVNSYHGVTHNYRRGHHYNIWFTFIAETMAEIDEHLADIAEKTGVAEICSMPAIELFKIKVDFPV